MNETLSSKDRLFIGSMLFGLFFGAGNLIFPVHMGQEAGQHVWPAVIGFLVTAIGIPFLGIMAISFSEKKNLLNLASRVNKRYAFLFTLLLYLVIGPFFSLPRLATTSFEIAFATSLPEHTLPVALAIYSLLFFVVAWWLSRKPTKLVDYIGKFLNPTFLILLGILLLIAFVFPMGHPGQQAAAAAYQSHALMTGFVQGYNTLDALAALAFGLVVVQSIQEKGVTSHRAIAGEMSKSGIISIALMGLIYTFLALAGAMSVGHFGLSENGGIALAQIAHYYLGTYGSLALALIVILACLKTAIGLIVACSETFVQLFPQGNYRFFIAACSILPCIFANVGLTKIIEFSLPVLMFIYPLAIVLILLTVLGEPFHVSHRIYQTTIYFTLIAAVFDALQAAPAALQRLSWVQALLGFAQKYLPLFSMGMGWVVPACVGLLVGILWQIARPSKQGAA